MPSFRPSRKNLQSTHYAQLEKHFLSSGLTTEVLEILRVSLVAAHADKRIDLPVPCARIPYFDLDGNETDFYRLRTLQPWLPEGEEKTRRYVQPARSGNHLYLAPLLSSRWRDFAHDPKCDLIITEGEKKAARACLDGFATIGLGGVWNWRCKNGPIAELDWFAWADRKVFITFDSPDTRINKNVRMAIERLSAELRGRGADVRIVELTTPSHQGLGGKIGLDDFLQSEAAENFKALLANAPQFLDRVSELNESLACVMFGAKAYVLREDRRANGELFVDFGKPSDIKPIYANQFVTVPSAASDKRVNVFDHWMRNEHRREYARVVFRPQGCLPEEYNLWQGLRVTPQAGDCERYLAHLKDNVCSGDRKLYEYVMAWMAHAVQRPGELVGTALVLRGKQGTGKGIFAHTFGALFGQHFLHLASTRHFLGNFNAHTKDKLILYADEAFWAGDKSAEGVLKALITEPTRMIEYKGRDAILIDNYTRLIVSSNHDWVVPAGLEERRFVIIDVGANRMQDSAYFSAIKAQMGPSGLSALLRRLLEIDLDRVDLRLIPKTEAMLDTKRMSMSTIERFWFELLEQGSNCGNDGRWVQEVPCEILHDRYERFALRGREHRRATEMELSRALRKLVPTIEDVRRRDTRSKRQMRYWVFPSLKVCRDAFCERLGQPIVWEMQSNDKRNGTP
jgi:hypothetical protein